MMVSNRSEIKKYNVLFTTIMKLRRLCNHGTLQTATLSCSTPSGKKKRSKSEHISTDLVLCEFCSGEDEDTAALLESLDTCPECSRCLRSQEASLFHLPMKRPYPNSPPGSPAPWASANRSPTPQSLSSMTPNSSGGLPAGHSSKVVAIIDNIQKSLNGSKR